MYCLRCRQTFTLLIRREQYIITLQCRTRNTIIFAPSNYQILNLLHCHSIAVADAKDPLQRNPIANNVNI